MWWECSRSAQVRSGGRGGKEDGEGRALARSALDQDPAVVGLDDAVRDGKSESDARGLVLGAEEGIEDPLAHLGRDSAAAVRDGELERIARHLRERDAQIAARGH